ncbi:MAG: endonuclease NucS [Candidatus Nezhaarchaeota archaeon]|nr:endonuclease NucS [Candidatus Nezhaarchaeota archaeon]MCX8142237.1 endonuclease NucS [Candidatus Nezhaarchaeota archaeon]MDW8050790.1 endonuclease NucS [Nitrososphaerota archaeon]
MRVLVNPSIEEACSLLREGIASHEVVMIIGECEVEYEGRASSSLTSGERFIIIKQDGSILVHRPEGYEPVNWQPSGCTYRVSASKNELKVIATRLSPREVLSVLFRRVDLIAVTKLRDEGVFSMYVSEEDMKEAIMINPSIIEDGLKLYTLEKSLEGAGYADIVGEDSKGNFVVIEVKRVPAGIDEVLQLARYVNEAKHKVNRPVRGILVAPSLRKRGQVLLEQLKLEFRALSPSKCVKMLGRSKDVKLHEFMARRV